jgi:hypothetical protein
MRVIFMISLLAVRSICPMADDFYAFQLRKWGDRCSNNCLAATIKVPLPDEAAKDAADSLRWISK